MCDTTDEKCLMFKRDDGQLVCCYENKMVFMDIYGNTVEYDCDGNLRYKQVSPTYEELYEYWLKTKDKPNRKRKNNQLPGQTDMFDIIDNN